MIYRQCLIQFWAICVWDTPPRIIIVWAKDTTGFTVSVTRNVKSKTSVIYMPKLILALFGTPSRITFVLQDGLIVVRAGDEKS